MAAPPAKQSDIELPDLGATAALARKLAELAWPGAVIGLSGPLGSGKTTFARAFIEAAAERFRVPREEVPSPTFTLVQTYEFPGMPVWHFDLYRLSRPEDAFELGIEDAFAGAVSLIEWPERLGPYLPADRLDLQLEITGEESRRARLTARGSWIARLERLHV